MLIIIFINLFFSSIILAQSFPFPVPVPFYFQQETYSHTHGVRTFCSEKRRYKPYKKSCIQQSQSKFPSSFILYTKRNIYVLSLAYSSTNLCKKLSIWNVYLFDKIDGNLHFMHQIFGPQCADDKKIKEYINDFDIQSHIEYVEYIKNLFYGNNLGNLQQEVKDMFVLQKKIRENIIENEDKNRELINTLWQPVKYFFLQHNPQNYSIPNNTKIDRSNYVFSPFCWRENHASIIKLDNMIKTFLICNKRLCDDILVSIVHFLLPINDALFHCYVKSIEYSDNSAQFASSLKRLRDFFCFYRYE